MFKNLSIIVLAILVFSCTETSKKTTPESVENGNKMIPVEPNGGIGDGALSINDSYRKGIEKAHHKTTFLSKKAVRFDAQISFNGKETVHAKFTMLTDGSKIRVDRNDGSQIIYNNKGVFLCPKDAEDNGARFTIFTWTYFVSLPFKLNDPGANFVLAENQQLNDKEYHTGKLSFDQAIGDSPDDWYVLYTDKTTNQLHAAAYIVTYRKDEDGIKKAEEDPHAIVYKDFKTIDGIPMATQWEFYGWKADKGLTEILGQGTLSNLLFFDAEPELFEKPNNAKAL